MKRASERQITKDDPDSGGESADGMKEGIQRASAEVIAKRKIVRARRTVRAEPRAASAPKVNPFASAFGSSSQRRESAPGPSWSKELAPEDHVSTVQNSEALPLSARAKPAAAALVSAEAAVKQNEPPAENKEAAAAQDSLSEPRTVAENLSLSEAKNDNATDSVILHTSKQDTVKTTDESEPHAEREEAGKANAGAADLPKVSVAAVLQTSEIDAAAPNALDVVGYGIGENSSAVASKAEKVSVEETAAGDGKPRYAADAPSVLRAKGVESRKPVFSFGGIGGAVTGTSFGDAAAAASGFSFSAARPASSGNLLSPVGQVELSSADGGRGTKFVQTDIVTGEEEEEELFRARCKLFILESGVNWKERGVGYVKLNRHSETRKARLLMRTEGTLRVILNAPLSESFTLDRATERSVRFQGLSVEPEAKSKYSTFLVRFGSKDDLEKLITAVDSKA
jgi:Ran-binding protein 3